MKCANCKVFKVKRIKGLCISCYGKQYYLANKDNWNKNRTPEKDKEASRKYRQKHPERAANTCKQWRLNNREAALNIDRSKKGLPEPTRPCPEVCESCGTPETYRRGGRIMALCLDHCHTTGTFRGWLCHSCNMALGLLKDSPKTIENLLVYLTQSEQGDKVISYAKETNARPTGGRS